MTGNMSAGNLLVSASVLFSGSTMHRFAAMADILNLQSLSESEFYRIQDACLFPIIQKAYDRHIDTVNAWLGDAPLLLIGDGRCDSPGHSAKYGTYTLMDQNTGVILDFQQVQVSEVANSYQMEKEGLHRDIQKVQSEGFTIAVLATDRHSQVTKYMKEEHPQIDHQYDVWHLAKSVVMKLTEKAKPKKCSDLMPWIKLVSNHLWWSASTCQGDPVLLKEKWSSILHHIRNVHKWPGCELYRKCCHKKIIRQERNRKKWLKRGTPAFIALKKVVLNERLLRDLKHVTKFCHTGGLEVYHSVLTKYIPKRQHFSFKGMLARTQLAVMDHNLNIGRELALTRDGSKIFKVVHTKSQKDWVAKPVYQEKDHGYIDDMIEEVLEWTTKEHAPLRKKKAVPLPSPIACNIARVERPPKEVVIAKHRSRMGLSFS